MKRWREYPWTSPWFRAKLWFLGIFGKKMNCGCRGYCRGHEGCWSRISWKSKHVFQDWRHE